MRGWREGGSHSRNFQGEIKRIWDWPRLDVQARRRRPAGRQQANGVGTESPRQGPVWKLEHVRVTEKPTGASPHNPVPSELLAFVSLRSPSSRSGVTSAASARRCPQSKLPCQQQPGVAGQLGPASTPCSPTRICLGYYLLSLFRTEAQCSASSQRPFWLQTRPQLSSLDSPILTQETLVFSSSVCLFSPGLRFQLSKKRSHVPIPHAAG